MKVKLTYEFDLPQEKDGLLRVIKGSDVVFALWEFQEHVLRSPLKYGHDMETADEALEYVRDELIKCLREDNIDIYELVGN